MQYCAILFWLNQLCVRWVIQRNKRGLAQALLAPNNQAASRKIRVALWRLRWSFVCAWSKVKYSRMVPSGST